MKWKMGDKNGLKRFQGNNVRRVTAFARMAMQEVYSRISIQTPVDTGNARWNWWCSVGKIDYKYEEHFNLSIDWGRAEQAFIAVKPGNTLYIANSTPYIKRLNEGWSDQKPARFVELTAAGIENDVNKLAKQAIRENP